jgi:large conductance mechanosensitive channel
MASGFKTFLLRGNLVDMAVGILIGIAFGSVVTAFVKDLITPIIAALFGKPDFSGIYFTANQSKFLIGDFINVLIAFIIIAAVLYFLVVSPYAMFKARYEKAPVPELPTKPCPRCLSNIPQGATRCPFCTTDLS